MSTGAWSGAPSAGDPTPFTGTWVNQDAGSSGAAAEHRLVLALRDGDEAAFVTLVRRYHPMLGRMARLYVSDDEADKLAQDVWCGALSRLDALADCDSFRVALLALLHERARHHRSSAAPPVPFAAHWDAESVPTGPSVDPSRFRTGEPWSGHWAVTVAEWQPSPVDQVTTRAISVRIEGAIARLPGAQREVLVLRDVEGWTAPEVSAALGISEARQRLLLHAARSGLRAALDAIMSQG